MSEICEDPEIPDAAGSAGPPAIDVGDIMIDGEVNVAPDGPVLASICVDNGDGTFASGVLVGQCEDGVTTWKSHDIGSGIATGEPADYSFGACPVVAPIEVAIVRNDVPVIEVDTVPFCNAATGLLEYHQTIATDGVPADTVIITTATVCVGGVELPVGEFDTLTICRNGTQHVVTFDYDENGVRTELEALDTGIDCFAPAEPQVTYSHVCMVDDIDGNPDNFVTYYDWTCREIDTAGVLSSTILGSYSEQTTDPGDVYAPVGAQQITCAEACKLTPPTITPNTLADGETLTGPQTYAFPPSSGLFRHSVAITGITGESIYTSRSGKTLKLRAGQAHEWGAHGAAPLDLGTLTIPAGGEVDVTWTEPNFNIL